MSTQKKRFSAYDKARCARLAAVQALFQSQLTQVPLDQIQKEFLDLRFSENEDYPVRPNESLFQELVNQIVSSYEAVIALLEGTLKESSKLSRQEPVIKAILVVAVTEIMDQGRFPTPAPVIISEYVAITEGFSDAKQSSFINRVLDQIARKLGRPLSL